MVAMQSNCFAYHGLDPKDDCVGDHVLVHRAAQSRPKSEIYGGIGIRDIVAERESNVGVVTESKSCESPLDARPR